MRRSSSSLLSLSRLSTIKVSTLILCIMIFSTLSFAATPDRIAGAIDSRQRIALAKSLHPQAQPQYDQGPVDPSRQLSYITLLTSPSASQQKALSQLLAQQQDRTSPNYHKWLTPQQYADRFGLSSNDLTRIATWLTSQGFQILSVGGGRNSIVFSGTAADVQRAFGTEIHSYRVNGEEHFANSTPLMIPSALQGIVTTVIGLHDFRPQPATRGKNSGRVRNPIRDYYDGNYLFPNFLAPDDIATIYDIAPLYTASTPIDGTGQKLAIVGQTDIYLADINDFRVNFNLSPIPTTGAGACTTNSNGIVISPCTTTNFAYVLLGADPGVPSSGDLMESDLDIEWSGAVARNAQIVFVNAETTNGVYDALTAAINPPSGPPLAPVVSMSYGYCEIGAPDLETLFEQGNAEGVTIVNSAGDVGAAACDYNPPGTTQTYTPPPPYKGAQYGVAVSYPASSQYVTGVGGTAISLANDSYPTQSSYWSTTLGANGGTAVSYIPELPWNDDEEIAQYCHAPAPHDTFCSTGGGTTGWVALGSSATAAQVQEDIWISMGGGGASNCWFLDNNGVCLAPPTGGFPQPQYQQALFVPSAPVGARYVPDVSMLSSANFPGYILCTPLSELNAGGSTSSCASGIFSAVDNYSSIVGGTSAAAPVFAGIVTLLNQDAVQSGLQSAPGLGNINPTLYNLAANSPTAFHQVTTGDNMVYCQPGLPRGYPTNIVCPAAVAPATQGVFGFKASNKDSATGYNLVTGLGSVDANNLATAWVTTVAATTTTVQASPTTVFFGQSVTLTATVSPSSATGTVNFYNNGSTTALGSGTLNGGVATFATTSLPVGTNSISATYTGDNLTSSSTTPAVVTVEADPTFSLSTPTTPAPVLAGLAATSTFTATPTGGTSEFAASVNISCPPSTSLPQGVGCSVNPTQIPASQSATLVTVTLTTAGPNTSAANHALRHRADNRSPWLPLALPLAGIVMAGFAGRKMSRYSVLAGLCVSLALLGLLLACGGGSQPPVVVTVSQGSPPSLFPNDTADGWPAQTAQFTATVTNSTQGVTWTASSGTIVANTSNPLTATYTAPTVASGLPTSVTVTATSQADSTKFGQATETITPATIPGTYPIMITVIEGSITTQTATVTLTTQ